MVAGGPIKDETNSTAELEVLLEKGYDQKYIIDRLRVFGGNFDDIVNLTIISGESKRAEEKNT